MSKWAWTIAVTGLLAAASVARAEYALRDGDTVVFLGDSITAARTYGKIVENYTLLRYPDRNVRFYNAGWGGDTAAGGLKRLDRDVFSLDPTVLIVAYGINDIGWGTKADDAHKREYLDSVRGIVERCRERKVRVFICSAAATAEDPAKSETGYLQRMCDEGMAIARALGEHSIDVQRAMRAIQRRVVDANKHTKDPKDSQSLHAADGVHLNDLGQLAMAFAIIKGLGAPADVSSAAIEATAPALIAAKGCQITNLVRHGSELEFDRLDEGLPINFGLFGALRYRFIPIPDELNRYTLKVHGLAAGRYEIVADGRSLGTFTNDRLASGENLASATADGWEPGGPWEAQAWTLIHMTDARSELETAWRSNEHHLPKHPERAAIRKQSAEIDAKIDALRRTLLKPRPFHFVVRPARDAKRP
jgi:lysophospholipase L1-like esterase